MKKLAILFVAGLIFAGSTVPVLGWEFNMTGEYEYRFQYFGRTGHKDLFGDANVQDAGSPTFVGFAGPDIWGRGAVSSVPGWDTLSAGYLITRGGFSRWGSDAHLSDSTLRIFPVLNVNPAIKVFGVYRVGGIRNQYAQQAVGVRQPPLERYYMSQVSNNAYDTAGVDSWEQFRAAIVLPFATLSIGVKDFPFGTNATWGYNQRNEAFTTIVPYGPFRFIHHIWLSNERGFGEFNDAANGWRTSPDADLKPNIFQGLIVEYANADLEMGAAAFLAKNHLGRDATTSIQGVPFAAFDENWWVYIAYMKYFNGRFFANAEYAWSNLDRFILGFPQRYFELYHVFSEIGAVAGPAKLSLAYALSSGSVLNNNNITKVYSPWGVNYQALQPYQFLMFDTYGGGNQSFFDLFTNGDGHGSMSDGYAFAARLDYAVASNLNIWGSYIWAHRLERAGIFKGQFLSNGLTATPAQRQAFVANNFGAASAEAGGSINPFVDDGFIGWEADAGVDWKLLENFTARFKYAYWQPGQWFDQAYQAVTLRSGAIVTDGLLKNRDAIQAFQGSLVVDF